MPQNAEQHAVCTTAPALRENPATAGSRHAAEPNRRPIRRRLPTAFRRRPLHQQSAAGPPVIERRNLPAPPATAPDDQTKIGESGVLFARKGPILSVETVGPRTITVGKESTYDINIVNTGEVAAEDLVVYVTMPEWAEIAGAEPSNGTAKPTAGQPPAISQSGGTIQWRVGYLNAKARQRLTVRLIPRQSRPFDLAVRWEYKPVSSQAMIEVQEPRLFLQLEGPREVSYGKKETYRLKVSNNGTGNADNVVVMMQPMGTGDNLPASHKIGLLAAGEEKTLDVELTARQSGTLMIRVEARADGSAHAELAEKVFVRRPALKVEIDGPKVQFVGMVATYKMHVRNRGTAPAYNVAYSVTLPAGAKYLSGLEGAQFDASANKLEWTSDTLAPAAEQSFTVRCSMDTAGTGRIRCTASADDLTASAEALVRIDAVANLTLEVKEPSAPTQVGDEAIYEVHLRNKGSRDAEGVQAFVYFSRGIEPTSAEGGPNHIEPGQVIFQPIPSIAAGQEVVLKIRAKADVPGNHVFRAEVHCKSTNSRLIREATSLYYVDDSASRTNKRKSDEPRDFQDQTLPSAPDATPLDAQPLSVDARRRETDGKASKIDQRPARPSRA